MSIAKKIFIISSVLLASVLFFLGIYNISFKPKNDPSSGSDSSSISNMNKAENKEKPASDQKSEVNSKIGREKIYALSEEAVVSFWPDNKNDKIYYFSRMDGKKYSTSFDKIEKNFEFSGPFSGLGKVLWSPDGSKSLMRLSDKGNVRYISYDYSQKKENSLAEGIKYAIWNNLGSQIIYKYTDSKTKKDTLNVSNFDGSNWKKISNLSVVDAWIASVPQSSFVSFWNSPNSFEETSFNLVSLVGGETRKIFFGRFGADYLWSPDGTKSLVSYVESKGGSKMNLGVINNNGGEFQNLNIPTFVSKCVWSKNGKAVFYALPSFDNENNVLPNDYQSGKILSKDTFWKVDISSGKTERIVNTEEISKAFDASSLSLSADEDKLFFINKIDGKLYGINL